MDKKILRFALLSASLLVGSAAAINANIPAMAQHFDQVPLSMVEMLTTVPSLFLMISVLTSSLIAKRVGYKQTITIGLGIVMIAGIVPLLIDNFMIILISRAMLGFGVGLFNSLLVSMINYFYDAKERSSMYGLQSAFEGAGGIAITFIAGQLLKINWQAPFIAYMIAIPVFFIYFKFVPQVKTADVIKANGGDQIKKESHKSAGFLPVVYYVGLIFMAAMLYMIMGIKIASLMTGEGYGTASDASLVIILLSLGGISAGLLFGKILKVFNQLTTSIGLIILALAMVILGLSQNLVITFVGGYLTGFGFKIFMPSNFLAVVESGNVSKAAQKLHLTQPTLTRQLQQLEEIYGTRLFIRGSRQITLTNSGIILKRRAKEMLDLQDKTAAEIRKSEYDISGEITIGCGESSGNKFLPVVLKEFSKRYPKIKYNIYTAGSNQNKEKINEGLIDVAIVLEPIDKDYYQYLELPYLDKWCLVMKKDDLLKEYETIENHVVSNLVLGIANRLEVKETFKNWLGKEINAQTILNYDINSNLALLVESGLCYGISIDGVFKSNAYPNLTYRLLEPEIVSQSCLIWKKGVVTNQALEKFIVCAKELISSNQ